MVRTAILARFRADWLSGALPMVVEHRSDDHESLCASPSLWMGGRAHLEHLKSLDVGPGTTVHFRGPVSIGFVQGLVACLRVGAAVDLRAEGSSDSSVRFDGQRFERVGSDLPDTGHELAWIAPDGGRLGRSQLDELAVELAREHDLSEGCRVQTGLPHLDLEDSVAGVVAPLWARCELHTLMDAEAHNTALYQQSPPHLVFPRRP